MSEETSIKEMELLCEQAYAYRVDIDQLEEAIKEKRFHLDCVTNKILLLLEAHDKRKWETPLASFEVRERTSVKIPREDTDKALLFQWLKDKGIFWQTVGVNSQTLNSLYKSEMEAASHEGRDFTLPGVGEPEIFKSITIRKKR